MTQWKAVLFDMDGVLTETSTYHFLAWKELADRLGIDMDSSLNEQLKGVSRMESLERILKHGHQEGRYTNAEKQRMANEKNERYLSMIEGFTRENLFPGVYSLLNEIKGRGMQIAVASASHSAAMLCQRLEITELINFIADPKIVPGKPAPDLFLQCANALNLPPASCIGVEDAKAGIEAIKAAGMLAVGIGSPEILVQADLIYQQTGDIRLDGFFSYKKPAQNLHQGEA